jgi:hypothetical protein
MIWSLRRKVSIMSMKINSILEHSDKYLRKLHGFSILNCIQFIYYTFDLNSIKIFIA